VSFEDAVNVILDIEGGYVNDPNDPGGETKFGISKRAYPNLDIANLTIGRAKLIYYRDYWTPIAAVTNEPRLRLLAFDAAVNHGTARALRWLQDHETFAGFLAYRLRFYNRLSTWLRYGRGWMNRIARILDEVSGMQAPSSVDVLVDNRPVVARVVSGFTGQWGPVAYRVRPLANGDGWKLDVRAPVA